MRSPHPPQIVVVAHIFFLSVPTPCPLPLPPYPHPGVPCCPEAGTGRRKLCTTATVPGQDYAEKEKAAAKALEDVKANFYCELCDKQYLKHQEFDNHINSYDHAHKQRLKDLKQREFARNVASKSWKDEKKQEKALKRLHQLAELRKQSECTVEKEQQELTASRHQARTEKVYSLGNQVMQVFPDGTNASHRTGVSFSFSKKVPLKLESSASVFSENNEEAYDCSESPNHKTKQPPESCHSCTLVAEDTKAGVEKGLNIPQGHADIAGNIAAQTKILKENDQSSDKELEETVNAHPLFPKTKIHISRLDFTGTLRETEQESQLNESDKPLETLISPLCRTSKLCTQKNTYKHSGTTLANNLAEFPPQQPAEYAYASELHCNLSTVESETSFESSGTASGNMETLAREKAVQDIKPKALSFLHVISKDGSTALQWPTELLLFTKTEPCISYGCNPLYFDFRLSLNHRDGKQPTTNKASCNKHSTNASADENEPSGLIKDKQLSNEQDNQSLKPKKMKGSPSPRKAEKKADSDRGKEMNGNGQKYISDDLNENIPKVPAYLDVSQKDYLREKILDATSPGRSLKPHFHICERKKHSIGNESISFSAFMSRTKKHKATKCDLIYSEEKLENQNNYKSIENSPGGSSDISDNGRDCTGSFLCSKVSSHIRYSENEDDGSYAGCWRFSPSQKSSSDGRSSYSDSSISSTISYLSSSSSHRSNNHSRSHLLFCCKRKNKTVERHKCKHRKHNCISSSDDAEEDYSFHTTSLRTRNCTQRDTVKYQKHSRPKGFHRPDRSKQSRNRHGYSGRKHTQSRSYHCSKRFATRDSRSSERSSSGRRSRSSSSGSFSRQAVYLNKSKAETERENYTASGKVESTSSDSQNARCPSRIFDVGSSDIVGERKSLRARLFLEQVHSKKNQEQAHDSEGFLNNCRAELKDHSQSHFAIKFPSSIDDAEMSSLPEEALPIGEKEVRKTEICSLENTSEKDNFETSQINNVTLTSGSDYDNCLFKDIIQIGIGHQAPNLKMNTAIKDQSNILISEVQPFIQSCDPVPNDFPGAFPSNRYSLVASSIETKEELHDVSMNLNRVESNLNSYFDSAMHKYDESKNDLEVYSKSISPPPLTQKPITFSPDEIDKYRLLQLQAQQHMQKQILAKHLKVLPATGPAAFSATPAVQSVPVQQHASLTTIHHTLLQRFAVSTSVHPHSSHLSLAHIHPLSQSHFTPISLSPLAPAIIPTHPTLLTGHPLQLISTTPIHPSPMTLPTLPHTAFIPTLLTPHLNAAAASAIHLNPFIYPLFQGQDFHHHSCSSQTQQLPAMKEVFSISGYLN
uniref:Zinc finger protein 804B n=1 Tax=Crocodylus porosus TaxID=8502 RepID=A0A7M4F407_CROPO